MRQPPPTISIVIPTYNRPSQLAACLGAMALLDYPRDRFEVIVVDDQSPSPLDDVVAPFRNRLAVHLLRQEHAGPATARNFGAARAVGEFLAFTDDDCTPAPDWLRALAARFEDAPDHVIGGKTLNRLPDNPYSTASQALIDYLYSYFNTGPGRFFASNNLAVPAARFRELGGFETSIPFAAGEDREFCVRWARHGDPMLFAPEVIVHHAHAMDFRRFWRQHFNYGRGAYYFRQLVARGGQDRVRLEPTSFYSNLLSYPLVQGTSRRTVWLSVLLGVSQLANALGFFFEKAPPSPLGGLRKRRRFS